MRFLFLPSSVVPFHGKTLEERPLGGIETAVIRLAAALDRRGHEVTVISQHPNPPLTKPLYIPATQLPHIQDADVLIVVRGWVPIISGIKARCRLFWTGDACDQPQTIGLGDRRVAALIDGFLAVSKWQAITMAEASGFPLAKMWLVRNGIEPGLFDPSVQRRRRRLMYSSTPFRGLVHLPRLFARIREQVSDAELAVFSGYDVYAEAPGGTPAGFEGAMRELESIKGALASIPGVTYSPSIPQAALAREFQGSSILGYPNTFAETSCITAMEAMYAGCVPLTTNRAALGETVGDGGVLVEGTPGNPLYDDQFVAEAVRLLTDDQYWQRLSQRAVQIAQNYTWDAVAEALLSRLAVSGVAS